MLRVKGQRSHSVCNGRCIDEAEVWYMQKQVEADPSLCAECQELQITHTLSFSLMSSQPARIPTELIHVRFSPFLSSLGDEELAELQLPPTGS